MAIPKQLCIHCSSNSSSVEAQCGHQERCPSWRGHIHLGGLGVSGAGAEGSGKARPCCTQTCNRLHPLCHISTLACVPCMTFALCFVFASMRSIDQSFARRACKYAVCMTFAVCSCKHAAHVNSPVCMQTRGRLTRHSPCVRASMPRMAWPPAVSQQGVCFCIAAIS
eukprot:scaffold15988_cov24-Tisochrysis_lutea.AAC.2